MGGMFESQSPYLVTRSPNLGSLGMFVIVFMLLRHCRFITCTVFTVIIMKLKRSLTE